MRSSELALSCILLIVRDMYLGLRENFPEYSEETIRSAATVYHDEKWGLSEAGSTAIAVDETVFFLLKKCIYHWVVGIRLYLECTGLSCEVAQAQAVVLCSNILHCGGTEDALALRRTIDRYHGSISKEIRRVYSQPNTVPSNEWCAWLELEAVKMAAACEKEVSV